MATRAVIILVVDAILILRSAFLLPITRPELPSISIADFAETEGSDVAREVSADKEKAELSASVSELCVETEFETAHPERNIKHNRIAADERMTLAFCSLTDFVAFVDGITTPPDK
jgi:hypothetical protein